MPPYRKAVLLNIGSLPAQARKAIANNVLVSNGPWVLINMAMDPPVVLPSGKFDAQQWLDAMCAIRDQTEQMVAGADPVEVS
jgi:hypothetical protein